MNIQDLSNFKYNGVADYALNESNYIVAVKDAVFSDRNIVPLFYKSDDEQLLLAIDDGEIGDKIFIKRGNDTITQDIETRFYLNELFKISRGPLIDNDRYEFDHNLPKKWVYKNKIQPLESNELIEIFDADLIEETGKLRIHNTELRELIINTYIRDNQILFVNTGNTHLGPFKVKRIDQGFLVVEKSFYLDKFGKYNFPNGEFLQLTINGIPRTILYNPGNAFSFYSEEYDFSTDEEVITWFNSELSNQDNDLLKKDEVLILSKAIEKVINSKDTDRDTKRYSRLSNILNSTSSLTISKLNLLSIIPELSAIKEQIEGQEKKGLELRNDIESKSKELEAKELSVSLKKEEIIKLEQQIKEFTERREEQQRIIENELTDKIKDLKKEAAELDAAIVSEKDLKSKQLIELKDEITFQERRKDELKTVIETLRKEFIEDQKNAQDKLVELVRHKTHFDFISGKDLSINDSENINTDNFSITSDQLSTYKEMTDGINEIFISQQRHYTKHFIDNLLICIHQNTLTLLAGLPGTGKRL